MSAAAPFRRKWNAQQRRPITSDELAKYGLPEGREMSVDRSRQIATGATPTKPALPPAKPAAPKKVENDNPALWKNLNTIRDPNTGATKTTRLMVVEGRGVVLNTCTRSGKGAVAEALVFIPGAQPANFLAPK